MKFSSSVGFASLLTLGMAAALAGGCSDSKSTPDDDGSGGGGGSVNIDARAQELCATWMSCEGGNQLDVQACTIQIVSRGERARVSGCLGDFDEVLDCIHDSAVCSGAGELNWDATCDQLDQQTSACLESAVNAVGPAPEASAHAETLCGLAATCTGSSQLEEWSCQLSVDEDTDQAAAFGCAAEAQVFYDCAVNNNTCTDGIFEVSDMCAEPFSTMSACMFEASALGK